MPCQFSAWVGRVGNGIEVDTSELQGKVYFDPLLYAEAKRARSGKRKPITFCYIAELQGKTSRKALTMREMRRPQPEEEPRR